MTDKKQEARPQSVSFFKLREYDPFRTPVYNEINGIFSQIFASIKGEGEKIPSFGPYKFEPAADSGELSSTQEIFIKILKEYQSLLIAGAERCKHGHINEYLKKAVDLATACDTTTSQAFTESDFYRLCLKGPSYVHPEKYDYSRSTKFLATGLAAEVGLFLGMQFGFKQNPGFTALVCVIALLLVIGLTLLYRDREETNITKPDAYAQDQLANLFSLISGREDTVRAFNAIYGEVEELQVIEEHERANKLTIEISPDSLAAQIPKAAKK